MEIDVRPQSVMLSFLGLYVRGRDVAVAVGSLIEVFSRMGIGEEAVRSTVTRMVQRDLLVRHRLGRQVYVGLTPRSVQVLDDGHRRMFEQGAVNRDWDSTWTVVAFTLPDERRSERHDLRTRLQWAGFGPLQRGLWVAAGRRDVPTALADLQVDGHVVALSGGTVPPATPGDIVARAFDTDVIARAYADFVAHWATPDGMAAAYPDDLARQVMLHADWLRSVRHDPHLPLQHLPSDWPALEAERIFRQRSEAWLRPAARQADVVLDLLDDLEGASA